MRKLTEKKIVLASHNAGKLREISELLAPFGIEVVSAGELGLEEPEETESTFVGNARIKAHFAAKSANLPALSDDSGISVDALDGEPGVYTADWAETPNGRDFPMAMKKVWDKLEAKSAPLPRTAAFCCTLCLAWPDGHDEVFEGRVDGSLTWPMRGDRGFGFDPIFVPNGKEETFGEMDPSEKNAMSHRADAFAKFRAVLET
ncbi:MULTISPECIES: RdgB/HAM1 family non-canonical purine NTP pyrophosphatase [Halocynthiibacter]|uniref:dITP/XTP pyrophosphatase n=1 Tax=Halocynthiibacter halioticoli TaxID=2986804 RepID=A0AAE3J0N1_9RHOB|nr:MULTISPECIES: RdgB/HAM1 family non-canonical purine NTP pyrophosphatase [Halocynthiibacter]MCV6825603.1 RdgB/HAM1 family non-canonical purine NTP pyrophosphatase [Halocynthiibacter halioticoli]MCW4058604.1 RdgB/HAM1 family non-canonical purine NTP pyrophosphatase [Halocynthiibacter sp. SDUM655004]